MTLLWLGLVGLVLVFGSVVLFGAPFLPTLKKQIDDALNLLDLGPGQTMLELGCGDGRVLRAAAERGLNAVGYEINPLLVIAARLKTWRYRKNVRVIMGNYWSAKWPEADGIFVFLLDAYMEKLDKKITQQYSKPVKLATFAFKVPKRKIVQESGGVYLYRYP